MIGCCQNGDGAVLEWAGIGADRSNRSVVFGRHGKGNCLDNGPMESFFGYLKTELVHRTRFSTRREARAALFEYIEIFYNQRWRHSSIDYRTPAQARRDMTIAQAA